MAALPPYYSPIERVWHYAFRVICALILFFLIFPLVVIIPLSFNSVPYFSFTPEMLALDPAGYSTKWYQDFLTNPNWQGAVWNSVVIAIFATIISTTLGTLAALGLSRPTMPYRTIVMSILISPMIVPLIISAAGMFFFYSSVGLQGTHIGVILAHAALGTPFVVITVTATLVGFDHNLTRASYSLGASPARTFFKVIVPLITPGVISGALFAFITSFDEVVVVLFVGSFDQRTIPWQMFSGIREQISPTILAVATLLTLVSAMLLFTLELLRRRTERLRGIRET
ncbi:ABC transporter permease [Minwuia thermotolerans]|jgi:putative spermidine/putrescine transport system permease protein|uniref:Polyamine ABC transporter permease n=1 Tax=Minwuia thermotolerans TaxID=2056226 RepID=A0A2M9G6C3_9PROT|nr:ABC transporter permease [Minwuia thermotolerans]ANK82281.1 MAG: polyamine ABC transporter permease [Rhizobiales bacterium NRL2]PJK31269.1 polyamine ABC transporter permease [Minwuia thermotolerans]